MVTMRDVGKLKKAFIHWRAKFRKSADIVASFEGWIDQLDKVHMGNMNTEISRSFVVRRPVVCLVKLPLSVWSITLRPKFWLRVLRCIQEDYVENSWNLGAIFQSKR